MPDSLASLRVAWFLLLSLGGGVVTVIILTTPWDPLPGAGTVHGDPSTDFTSAQIARGNAFHSAVQWPSWLALGLGLVVAGLLGLTPAGARLVRRVGRRLRWWWLQVLAGVAVLTLVTTLVTLAPAAWSESIQRDYGLSVQSWPSWLADVAKGWAVNTVVTSIALLVLVGLARRFGDWWFVPAALAAFVFVVVSSFAYPVVVEPLFNSFTPMKPGPLRTSLLDLAARDGLKVQDVLVTDASQKTTALNAYVSGFGSTRRIVVYDTLLGSPKEVELIVAHELGHAKNNDVLHGTLTGALGASAGVVAIALLLRSRRLLRRAGASSAGDPAVVALLLALTTFGSFLSLPVLNLVSRHVEERADIHSLDLTHDPAGVIDIQKRLAIANISDLEPNRWVYAWFGSHPTTVDRIAYAREWARLHGMPVPAPTKP